MTAIATNSVYYFPPWGHAVPTDNKRQFASYDDFFAFYLGEHSKPGTRYMHLCGTVLGLAVVIAAIVTGHYWWILLWPVIGYGFAWIGHFGIEGNRPATFGHPFWSFISDFRMVYLMLTGQLSSYMRTISAPRG
jgi:hypothetical protein